MLPERIADMERILIPALEQATEAVIVLDEGGIVLFFNAAAERLWGYGRADVVGRHASFLLPREIPADGDGPMDAERDNTLDRIVGQGREVTIARKDGSPGSASLTLSKVEGEGETRYLGLLKDVGEEVDRRDELRLLSLVADETDRAILILGNDRRILYVNRAFTEMFGYMASEMKGRRTAELFAGANADALTLELDRRKGWKETSFQEDVLLSDRHGQEIWVTARFSLIADADGSAASVAIILSDMTDSKQIQTLQRAVLGALASDLPLPEVMDLLCRRVESIAPEVISSILLVDREGKLRPLASPSLPDHFSAALDGVAIGPDVGSCGTAAYLGEPVEVTDIATDPLWGPYKDLAIPLGLLACWSSPIRLRAGRVAGTFAFYFREKRRASAWHQRIVDACVHLCMLAIERHEAKEHIAQLAYFDALTALPNRALLRQHVARAIGGEGDGGICVLFLNLDRFRDVNETMGHSAGDALLVAVARRLQELLRPTDFVARIGGDEFAIVAPGGDARRATVIAERVLQAFAATIEVSGVTLAVSASIGISIHPANGSDAEALLQQADTALHQAKAAGRGTYRFFSPQMNQLVQDRLVLGAALRDAVLHGSLRLHYQPQLRPERRQIYGVEALARWTDPYLGVIPPSRFITLAEEIGLIDAIGEWSLREACRQMAAWRARGVGIPTVSVNLSPLQFRNRNLPAIVAEILREHALPAECLTVEITETVMMEDRPETLGTVRAIRALGVGLSMDDFGTGFSSLSSLVRLPVTELKIDRSFMSNLGGDASAQAVTTAVIGIGRSLGMTVIAEGVETEAQWRMLSLLHCEVAQGYMFARPLPVADLEGWISDYRGVAHA